MSARPSRTSSTAFTSAACSQKTATIEMKQPDQIAPTQVRIAASSAVEQRDHADT